MSTPAHLWLEDENGSPIVGNCLMPLRLGSIELKSFSHGVTIPVDSSWGKLTGTRVHRPITIVKEFDQTTPLLVPRCLRRPYLEESNNQDVSHPGIRRRGRIFQYHFGKR